MDFTYENIAAYQHSASQVLAIESVINACKERDTILINNVDIVSISEDSCTLRLPKQFLKKRRIGSFDKLRKEDDPEIPEVYPKDLFCIRVEVENHWKSRSVPEVELLQDTLMAKNIWCAHATLCKTEEVSADYFDNIMIDMIEATLKIQSCNFKPPQIMPCIKAKVEILEKLQPEK